jgi:hypothetical protein
MRSNKGELLSEFGAAITIFICCLLPPLLNIGTVTFRYLAAYALAGALTHNASLCDTRHHAIKLTNQPGRYQSFAKALGINFNSCDISIVCKNDREESLVLPLLRPVPVPWLPGGQRGPCQYLLQTDSNFDIPPLISTGLNIPVLSTPINVTCTMTAPWENLGCDPVTQDFYINE